MYLGIDLGTSSVKLVLLNDEQNIVAQNSQPLTVSNPQPLWSEQDPQHWWQATCAAAHALREQHPKQWAAIKAIGLSGQQHGATLLDVKNKVLRPAILWNDGRSQAQCEELEKNIAHYSQIIGSRVMPGFTAPKVLWVKQHEPEIFKQLHKVLLPKDYLRLMLTDEYASDMSDASGTGWLDIAKRNWSEDTLNAVNLKISNVPQLFEGSAVTGTITKKIAAEWGIAENTVVVGGGGDNPASAISVNVIKPGSAFLSLGTSGVYFVAADQYKANPQGGVHTFCHCLPKLWHHMTVHLSAASCVTWLSGVLNVSVEKLENELKNKNICSPPLEKGVASVSERGDFENHIIKKSPLTPLFQRGGMVKNNVIFLPYLSGERTPHNDPYAKGVFFGLDHNTTRADLLQAVLEGVAFAFADGQDAMLQAGIQINEVSVVGGGARSLYWGNILASALNRPLIYRADREIGGALGAARLAWLGINKVDPQTAFATPSIEKMIEPDKELVDIYTHKRKIFKNIYQNLKDVFKCNI